MELYYLDTHCHLWHLEFLPDISQVLDDCFKQQVNYLINVGVDNETSVQALSQARKHRNMFSAIGYHPHYALGFKDSDLVLFDKLVKHNKVVALGEIGLDFYRKISNRKSQILVFDKMLTFWKEHRELAIIIHNRNADREILDLLDSISDLNPKVVMHCYSSRDENFWKECLRRGYFISFATNLTYSEELQEIARRTPLERILLETDAPYLPPAGKRGERNLPYYVKESYQLLAGLKLLPQEDIVRSIAFNARMVFNVGDISLAPVVAYRYKNNLYINLTNECTNKCKFCTAMFSDHFAGYNMRLRTEPSLSDIMRAVAQYPEEKEVTFCGYGEPFTRLQLVIDTARALKNKGYEIRVVTNGQANLIAGRNILPELKGIIDKISVSFHVEDREKYNRLCQPEFGDNTFDKIKEFVLEAKKYIPWVEITFLSLPGIDVGKCRKLAQELGVNYRLREYNYWAGNG